MKPAQLGQERLGRREEPCKVRHGVPMEKNRHRPQCEGVDCVRGLKSWEEAAGNEQPQAGPNKAVTWICTLESSLCVGEGSDQTIAVAHDQMIRPGLGDKAKGHFRKT